MELDKPYDPLSCLQLPQNIAFYYKENLHCLHVTRCELVYLNEEHEDLMGLVSTHPLHRENGAIHTHTINGHQPPVRALNNVLRRNPNFRPVYSKPQLLQQSFQQMGNNKKVKT